MSTVSVINVKHPSSASNNLVLNNAGNATFAGTAAMASSFLRNRIINGDMRIDQRNAGASVTPTTSGDWWTVDRWRLFTNGTSSRYSIQQSNTAPTGFTNSVLITSLGAYSVASGDNLVIAQLIEGLNVPDLGWGTASAQTVTLSFWVRSSLTGAFGGSIRNSGNTRSYPFSYTISAANTWEYKTVTIPGDTSGTWLTTNGIGVSVGFNIGSGSSTLGTANVWAGSNLTAPTGSVSLVGTNAATLNLTGVQLEVGSAATPFERRQYGQELALCQRYYGTATSQITANATSPAKGVFYKSSMRTAATIAGGGAGFVAINSTTEGFDATQTTAASQTLTFSAEL